ncbi:MAG TPA: SHOCT domain-containing protein [Kofleriaceae bacterium]|jgi:hypothetical protein|nr:SHOCT domain-containing protein [Kofleriaceae bacterium]
MRVLAAWLFAFSIACSVAPGGGSTIEKIMHTASGKDLVVEQSASFQTEPREVPADVVVQGLRASSMFFEEDIRALAPQITTALPALKPDQRLVVETSDTDVHIFVASNELQIISYRSGEEISRHSSAIPSAAVETHLTMPHVEHVENVEHVDHSPPPPDTTTTTAVTPPPPPPPDTTTTTTTPPPPPDKTVAHKPKHKPTTSGDDTKQTGRLSEAQIREKLGELDRLKSKGLITDTEYQQKKKALLDQL